MTNRRIDALAAAALVVLWSSGFVGAELGTRTAPALTLLAWRYAVAALLLGLVAAVLHRPAAPGAWRRQAGLGVLVQVLYLGGIVSGVGLGVPAGTAALVAAVQPLLVAAVGGPLLGERTTGRQRAGLAIGLVGVVWVVAGDVGGGTAPGWAYLLPVGGMLALTAGTVLQRRMRAPETPLQSLTMQTATAAALFVAVAGGTGDLVPPADPAFWWAVAWTVLLSSFGGYGAYLVVLGRSGALRVSTLLYLTPPVTAVWAFLMFGEVPGALAWPGAAACAVGVGLVLLGRPRESVGPPAHDGDHDRARRVLPRHP
ncbi:DMT family transporter [Pseudonocardia hydrocarbonoxydans]|uniref:Membrane protein n=1 Tax=Pseudonocardia hydrocarbonoxydans TaxID=76726 RepID=A0A4Y3WN07_9PSEU|nr:DMT family transporter [Pseudonocardia hydrocarbonoxydans]GEC19621.1 membrane protein [Pseudonocardia hydrocarbonoxydans]